MPIATHFFLLAEASAPATWASDAGSSVRPWKKLKKYEKIFFSYFFNFFVKRFWTLAVYIFWVNAYSRNTRRRLRWHRRLQKTKTKSSLELPWLLRNFSCTERQNLLARSCWNDKSKKYLPELVWIDRFVCYW